MKKEWLGEVEIKRGLFIEPGDDHNRTRKSSLGKFTAQLEHSQP